MKRVSEYCSDEFRELLSDYSYSFNKPRTFDEYVNYINLICDYLCMDFMDITLEDAERYMSYMYSRMHDGKLSRKTIYVRLHCYRVVGDYAEERFDEYVSPFGKIRMPDRPGDSINPMNIPSLQELDKFMTVTREYPMYYLIYALATRVGLTASAILRMRTEDIVREQYGDGESVFLRVDESGLFEERYIALPKDVSSILDDYLAEANIAEGVLFRNKHKNPLTLRNLDAATERFVKEAGIRKFTMKDFRSRAILELIKTGTNIASIREYTGLSQMRIGTFAQAKGFIERSCPADLVNYELKTNPA